MIGGKLIGIRNNELGIRGCFSDRPDNNTQIHNSLFMLHDSRKSMGFTLVEMLLALAIFSVVVTVAADLFLAFQKTSRKTENLETVVANTRLVVERIASAVRSGSIDYATYTDLGGVDSEATNGQLYLLDSSDRKMSFTYTDDTIVLTLFNGNSEALTGDAIRVLDAQFFVLPIQDPFAFNTTTGHYLSDNQPRVKISLSLDNNLAENNPDYTRYDVQTTISSRVYKR